MLRETSSWDTLPLSSSWLIWSKLLRGSSRRSSVFQRCLGTRALPALLHMEGSQGWNTQWCLLNWGKQQASDWHKVSCVYLRSMRQEQSPWKGEHKLGDLFLLILPLVLQNAGIFSNSDHLSVTSLQSTGDHSSVFYPPTIVSECWAASSPHPIPSQVLPLGHILLYHTNPGVKSSVRRWFVHADPVGRIFCTESCRKKEVFLMQVKPEGDI